jgi:hypothetical protein
MDKEFQPRNVDHDREHATCTLSEQRRGQSVEALPFPHLREVGPRAEPHSGECRRFAFIPVQLGLQSHAKRGAFSPAACGDPVFRARGGFGRPGAKVSLHSG